MSPANGCTNNSLARKPILLLPSYRAAATDRMLALHNAGVSRSLACHTQPLTNHSAAACTSRSLCCACAQADYTRYAGVHLAASLTLPLGARQGAGLMSRLPMYLRPKCARILLDPSITSSTTLRLNIYQVRPKKLFGGRNPLQCDADFDDEP